MGKKAPTKTPAPAKNTRTPAAAEPPATEQADLLDASALLDKDPTDFLVALAKGRSAAEAPATTPMPAPAPAVYVSDDDYDSKPKL